MSNNLENNSTPMDPILQAKINAWARKKLADMGVHDIPDDVNLEIHHDKDDGYYYSEQTQDPGCDDLYIGWRSPYGYEVWHSAGHGSDYNIHDLLMEIFSMEVNS